MKADKDLMHKLQIQASGSDTSSSKPLDTGVLGNSLYYEAQQ